MKQTLPALNHSILPDLTPLQSVGVANRDSKSWPEPCGPLEPSPARKQIIELLGLRRPKYIHHPVD